MTSFLYIYNMEKWKYNPIYDCEISNLGNARNAKTKKLFATNENRIYLRNHKGRIHRMVAETWLDNPKCYKEVNHINGIKHDNRVDNLEWCDRSHNEKHKVKMGLHNTAKLTMELAEEIRKQYKPRVVSTYTLAKKYNVSQGTIHQIIKEKIW